MLDAGHASLVQPHRMLTRQLFQPTTVQIDDGLPATALLFLFTDILLVAHQQQGDLLLRYIHHLPLLTAYVSRLSDVKVRIDFGLHYMMAGPFVAKDDAGNWEGDIAANCAELQRRKVFGLPLKALVAREPSLLIPRILYGFLGVLHDDSVLAVEGLFRVVGSHQNIESLRDKLDSVDCDAAALLLSPTARVDSHDVAGLFKRFVRELPEPLLTFDKYDQFVSVSQLSDVAATRTGIKSLVQSLPVENRRSLICVLWLLHQVALRSDVNKMTASNLAACLAPNFIKAREDHSIALDHNDLKTMKSSVAVLAQMISNYKDFVFETEEEEVQRIDNLDMLISLLRQRQQQQQTTK
jgi:hypothetical protein